MIADEFSDPISILHIYIGAQQITNYQPQQNINNNNIHTLTVGSQDDFKRNKITLYF